MPGNSAFDPETLSIMGRALDEAWAEFESRSWVRAEPEKSGIRDAGNSGMRTPPAPNEAEPAFSRHAQGLDRQHRRP